MTASRRDWDVIVVGLGALGSAATYWAATRPGTRVLGLEQFELGHANGASADHSRIIRLSYHRPDYVRLAKRAYEMWAAVEAEARERIVTVTGGLDLWPAGATIPKNDVASNCAMPASDMVGNSGTMSERVGPVTPSARILSAFTSGSTTAPSA